MANKEALRELQKRLDERLQKVREQAPTRNWLAVDVAGYGFLLPLDQIGEIFPLSVIQTAPHSRPWFMGVANLRGQLHGVVDLAGFMGLTDRVGRRAVELGVRDSGRFVALNAGLQSNSALMIDKLLGLRNPASMTPNTQVSGVKPHFVGQQLVDSQGRAWYELDLAALVADEAFLKVDV